MQTQISSNSSLRFEFGENWSNFLQYLNEERIVQAEKSLKEGLGSLKDKTFLDVGSGSGLFSLAAYRLGSRVISFDFDDNSVSCTKYLKMKFAHNDERWTVIQGSILDTKFLKQFEKADIVYSWGVLHHTGNMYQAFENISSLVSDNGKLFISIYNDQGGATRRWKWIKERYNRSGAFMRLLLCGYGVVKQWTLTFIKDFLKSGNPFRTWKTYSNGNRGMSAWHDIVDLVGGYPFETAKPEEVFNFFKSRSFELLYLKTCAGGVGCNEFVFLKRP